MPVTSQGLVISERARSWIVYSAILLGLLGFLYGPALRMLVEQWWTDPDYSHGFFVPLFSGYVLWRRRKQLIETEIKPQNSGLLVMISAVCLLLVGSLGAELFIMRLSLLVLVAGIILFLAGGKLLQAVSFPLGFLIFMIPIPVIFYNQITFPLQLIASRLATSWLNLVQVPVLREGNILVMPNYSLEVVEACSGIRSLMTLTSLAVAYGYLAEGRLWARHALAMLMVPSAVVTNAIRIVVAGVLAQDLGPVSAKVFLHTCSGWLVFLAALALLFVFHWILRRAGRKRSEMIHA